LDGMRWRVFSLDGSAHTCEKDILKAK